MSKRWNPQKQQQQGTPWPGWSPQWPQSRRGKGNKSEKPGQEGANPKSKEGLPLSYSSLPVGNGETTEDQGAQAFMDAFVQLMKDGKTPIPDTLQQYLPDPEREDLKTQQKLLNRMRAVKQKIQGKEKALAKDECQWLEEVRQTVETQKQQHEETQDKLKKELQQLQEEEATLRATKPTEVMEVSEEETQPPGVEDMLDKLIAKPKTPVDPKPAVAEEDVQQQMQQKLQEMQEQLQADFQHRLQAAQAAMEQRYVLQMQKLTPVANWTAIKSPEIISLLDEGKGQEIPDEEKKGGDQQYGADRPRTKTEVSPYRKDSTTKTRSMEDRLRSTHGSGPPENG